MRVQLTVRVEPHTSDYVNAEADRATRISGVRISASQAAAALLERAEAEGWQITPAALHTSRPGLAQSPPPGRAGTFTDPPGK